MEVPDWLKLGSDTGRKPVKQIVFAGVRFDLMSVRRWRERVLGGTRIHSPPRAGPDSLGSVL